MNVVGNKWVHIIYIRRICSQYDMDGMDRIEYLDQLYFETTMKTKKLVQICFFAHYLLCCIQPLAMYEKLNR